MPQEEKGIEGDYRVMDPSSAVAVAIVGRGRLDIPPGLCHMAGTFKTENLGIEKIIANILRRPQLRHLVVCGREEFGHFPGDALISLFRDGVDEDMRIIGTKAPIPFLCNTPPEAVERIREQVQLHDLVHPKDAEEIIEYDPVYEFDPESRERLLSLLRSLQERDDPPFGEPMFYRAPALFADGEELATGMHHAADRIVSGMLGMANEKLATTAPYVIVSGDPGVVLDPVKGVVEEAPSVELMERMRHYLTGGL